MKHPEVLGLFAYGFCITGVVEGAVDEFEYIRRVVVGVEDLENTICQFFLLRKAI